MHGSTSFNVCFDGPAFDAISIARFDCGCSLKRGETHVLALCGLHQVDEDGEMAIWSGQAGHSCLRLMTRSSRGRHNEWLGPWPAEGKWFTLHVGFPLEHDEGVASVGLLLLVRLLVGTSIGNEANLLQCKFAPGTRIKHTRGNERAQSSQSGQSGVPSLVHPLRNSGGRRSWSRAHCPGYLGLPMG